MTTRRSLSHITHHTDDDVMVGCISNISMSPLDNVAPCSVVTNKLLAPSVTLGSHVTSKHKQPNIYTYLHISSIISNKGRSKLLRNCLILNYLEIEDVMYRTHC